MNYFLVHIGEPNNDAWWAQLVGMNIVAAGVDNRPDDRGATALRDRIEPGDTILAYSPRPASRFVGVGVALGKETYRLLPDRPAGYLSPNRHQRGVRWVNWATTIKRGVRSSEYGPSIPVGFCTVIRDPLRASRFVELLKRELDHRAPIQPPVPPPPKMDAKVMRWIKERRGQTPFRQALIGAYGRCAISGCTDIPVLEAAHITPHSAETNYDLTNGLLLRADIHTLFDLRLVSIDPESGSIVVAKRLSLEYQRFNGAQIARPTASERGPDPQRLRAHLAEWQAREQRHKAGLSDDDGGFED